MYVCKTLYGNENLQLSQHVSQKAGRKGKETVEKGRYCGQNARTLIFNFCKYWYHNSLHLLKGKFQAETGRASKNVMEDTGYCKGE